MSTPRVISALQAAFPGEQMALPGTEEYMSWNSYLADQETEIQPAIIFRPKSTAEVATFVKVIEPFSSETAFAIRAGGNMPLPGCANVPNGVTLDLSLMADVELDKNNNSIVRIPAGAHWKTVYEVLQDAGLAVAGGRSGTGGIGGLALAGGLSFFSSRRGFICDNIVNFEIVSAAGDVLNANAEENQDLWVALKGGSNNFGIVTRFDFMTFEQAPFWGGNVYYFPPSFPGQLEALATELQKQDADPDTHYMISIGYSVQFKATMCLNTVYYTKESVTEAPSVLAPFTNIQPQVQQLNSLKAVTLTEAAAGQAAGISTRVRCAYMNTTVRADVGTLQAAAELYTAGIVPLQGPVPGLTCSLTFQPFTLSLLRQSVLKGGNSLGLEATGPAVSVLLLTYWKESGDDQRVLETMTGVLEKIRSMAVERRTALEYVYLNYAAGFQSPIDSYGSDNKRKLQEVSRRYDPKGLFQNSVPGGFKLF